MNTCLIVTLQTKETCGAFFAALRASSTAFSTMPQSKNHNIVGSRWSYEVLQIHWPLHTLVLTSERTASQYVQTLMGLPRGMRFEEGVENRTCLL